MARGVGCQERLGMQERGGGVCGGQRTGLVVVAQGAVPVTRIYTTDGHVSMLAW